MKLGRNVAAAFASSVWSALLGFIAVPLYLHYLGIEAYGLIGFFATTQALFQILDLGLAPAVNRELARFSASGAREEAQRLLHTLAVIYWSVAVLIVALMLVLAAPIAEHWLSAKQLPRETVMRSLMLMGCVIACRWPVALYQAALNGMQLLTVSSGVNIAAATASYGGAVAALAFVSPTLEMFFVWQTVVGLAHAVVMRRAAWRALGSHAGTRFALADLKRIWRFSASMSAITLSALVFTQLDKVVLSKLLPLEEFGHYMLASSVAAALYILTTPLFNAVYPRFSALVMTGHVAAVAELYRLGTRLLATVLFPTAIAMAAFAEDFVTVWTHDAALARDVAPIIGLLALGSALHGVMYFPYALQLAYGMPRLALQINLALMVVLVPLILVLATVLGAVGGALAWLTLHCLYVLLGTGLTHRKLLVGIGTRWLLSDVGVPLALSLVIVVTGHYLVQRAGLSPLVDLLCGAVVVLLAAATSFAVSPRMYASVASGIGWRARTT
jgi:O-antigen/teichoic acid export membrane protein